MFGVQYEYVWCNSQICLSWILSNHKPAQVLPFKFCYWMLQSKCYEHVTLCLLFFHISLLFSFLFSQEPHSVFVFVSWMSLWLMLFIFFRFFDFFVNLAFSSDSQNGFDFSWVQAAGRTNFPRYFQFSPEKDWASVILLILSS